MIVLRSARLHELPLRLRLPFRYGIATLTELPHAVMTVTWEFDGRVATGFAADNLPPKWFTKDPTRAPAGEIAELWTVIRAALHHAKAIRAPNPFAFWHELNAAQAEWAAQNRVPPLLANFGTTLVERTLLDGFCRIHGMPFAACLRANAFAIDLGRVRPALRGSAPADWLPARPLARVTARHTVGLADPLDSTDPLASGPIGDGLPETLVENIRAYGLRHFKIKINGDAVHDRQRLERIARILRAECPADYGFSLDGNESFQAVDEFRDYARELMAWPGLADFWPHLLFIEQPWHRDVALTSAIGALAKSWPDRPPIIIDESDASITSLPAALALGYAGTSHKNCKGVFKSILNACEIAQRRSRGTTAILTAEDLTNVGPIALTQDLAVAAALGIGSVERNGHHYFAGLSQFPPALQQHALDHHPDLFVRDAAGWPRVQIRAGELDVASVNAAPFGVGGEPDCRGLTEVAAE